MCHIHIMTGLKCLDEIALRWVCSARCDMDSRNLHSQSMMQAALRPRVEAAEKSEEQQYLLWAKLCRERCQPMIQVAARCMGVQQGNVALVVMALAPK